MHAALPGQQEFTTTILPGTQAGEPLRGARIGLNFEMVRTSDSMWKPDNYRMHGKSRGVLAEGQWPNNKQPLNALFTTPVTARFFKLASLREVPVRSLTRVAEIDLLPD